MQEGKLKETCNNSIYFQKQQMQRLESDQEKFVEFLHNFYWNEIKRNQRNRNESKFTQKTEKLLMKSSFVAFARGVVRKFRHKKVFWVKPKSLL